MSLTHVPSDTKITMEKRSASYVSTGSQHQQPIDLVSVSADQGNVVAFSKQDGKISWWKVVYSPQGVASLEFSGSMISEKYKTISERQRARDPYHILVAISDNGEYVSLSTVMLNTTTLKEYREVERDAKYDLSCDVIDTRRKEFITLPRTCRNITGYAKFTGEGHFLLCGPEHLHIVDIKTWKLHYVLDLPVHHHGADKNMLDIGMKLNVAINSIAIEKTARYLIWPDDQSLMSVWSFQSGRFAMRFKYAEGDLFALSNNGELLAVCRATTANSSTILIYSITSGLQISSEEIMAVIGFIRWTENDEFLYCLLSFDVDLDGTQDGTRVRLLDPWSNLFVAELESEYLLATSSSYLNPAIAVDKNWFIRVENTDVILAPFEPTDYHFHKQANIHEQRTPTHLIIRTEDGLSVGLRRDNDNTLKLDVELLSKHNDILVKWSIEVEPWLTCPELTSVPTVFFMDEKGERICVVGQYTVQVWFTFSQELQFIWRVPKIHTNSSKKKRSRILKATLHHFQRTNNTLTYEEEHAIDMEDRRGSAFVRLVVEEDPCPMMVELPLAHGFKREERIIYYDRNILINAVRSYFFLKDIEKLQLDHDHALTTGNSTAQKDAQKKIDEHDALINRVIRQNMQFLISRTRDIIHLGISNVGQPEVLNKVGKIIPFARFLLNGDSDLVDLVLDKDHWIPSVTRENNPIYIAMNQGDVEDGGNRELVYKLVKYCVKKAKKNSDQGYMVMIAQVFQPLCEHYPQLLKDILPDLEAILGNQEMVPWYDSRDMMQHTGFLEISEIEVYRIKSKLTQYQPEDWKHIFFAKPWQVGESFLITTKRKLESIMFGISEDDRKPLHTRTTVGSSHANQNFYVVPFPNFCVYPARNEFGDSKWSLFYNTIIHPTSPFIALVDTLPADHPLFNSPIMEAVLNFKWHKYAKTRYFFWLILYFIYFLLFVIVVSVKDPTQTDGEVYDNSVVDYAWENLALNAVIALALLFLAQEMRQMMYDFKGYIWSLYNVIDMGTFILPLTVAIMAKLDMPPPVELEAIAILMLWTNALLQLRISRSLGIFVAIVIEIGKRIAPLLFVLLFVVLGFTQAFYVLVRADIPDMPEFTNQTEEYSGGSDAEPKAVLSQIPEYHDKMFTHFDTALRAVYDFVGNDFSAVEKFHTQRTLDVLVILFNFIVTIILLNVLIALMAKTFEDTIKASRRAWLRQMAEIVAECEIYRMWPWERRDPRKFPAVIYYAKTEEAYLESQARLAERSQLSKAIHGEEEEEEK